MVEGLVLPGPDARCVHGGQLPAGNFRGECLGRLVGIMAQEAGGQKSR
jgi:hypothetical protein